MSSQRGTNLANLKEKNRALALELICRGRSVSRSNLAENMHLTKTTLGNIVSDLIAHDIIGEYAFSPEEELSAPGRKPIILDLSPGSPLIAGMLIKRKLLSAILSDLKGRIVARKDYTYEEMDRDMLVEALLRLYGELCEGQGRRVVAIGVSCVGPVDTRARKMDNPANFWGISDLPLPEILRERTGLPAYIIHDGSAGALAEKLYGLWTDFPENLLYLHIMNGIGAGYILHGNIYGGDMGRSGELGHMSVNFDGPLCSCGNRGCLELYANVDRMNRRVREMRKIYRGPVMLSGEKEHYAWSEMVEAAAAMDFPAMTALDEFCGYLAHALENVIRLLDINHIIVGYDAGEGVRVVEEMLEARLNDGFLQNAGHKIRVMKSSFGGQAPLIGSAAVVADRIFKGELKLY